MPQRNKTPEARRPERPFIVFEDVTLRVNHAHMFEGTNWTMTASQHWHVFGPTGSGKSLLAAAVCRKVPVVKGRIRYFFDDPKGPGRTSVNPGEIHLINADAGRYLIQRYAGYHQARWQSFEGESSPIVSEVLLDTVPLPGFHQMPRDACEVDQRRKKMTEASRLLGISHLLDRNIIHLSNGEARKVLLARALMRSPKLLILDDPFAGLDTSSRETLRRVIETLLSGGEHRVMVLSSREDEILDGMTHLMCIDGGRITAQGLKERPNTDFRATLSTNDFSSYHRTVRVKKALIPIR